MPLKMPLLAACLFVAGSSAAQQFTLPPAGVHVQSAPLAQVFVHRIAVRGNTVLPAADIEHVARPHVGRINSAAELEALRAELTRLYTSRGYVNSGMLLPAQVDDGLLVITAVEGRLSGLRLRGAERLDERYLRSRLAGDAGEILNMEVLRERFQLLLSDPLVARLNARMMPGEQVGEAILDVDVVRARAWQFGAFANNYRPVAIGSQTIGLSGGVRNLTGQGDAFDASIQGSTQGSRGLRGALNWTMPVGFSGTAFQLGLDAGSSSVIEEATRELDIRSRLASVDAGFSHVLRETLQRKLVAGASVMRRENRTWLLDEPFSFVPGEPDGHVRETVWRAWADHAWRSATQVLALRATLAAGSNNIEAVAGLPAARMPARRFQLLQGQAHYGRQIGKGQLVLRAMAQFTDDRLLALDALALGGVNTVRGYRENLLVRDRGAFINAEFEYPVVADAERSLAWTLVPFADYGHAQNVGESGVSLGSAGLASRLQWGGLKFDLAIARKIGAPQAARSGGGNLQDRGVHLLLKYQF